MFADVTHYLIAGGLLVGLVYALIVNRFNLDMMSAVDKLVSESSHRQSIGFAGAFLVAIIGTFVLESQGIEVAKSSYRNSQLDWLGVLLGGFIFGVGARMAGYDAARVVVQAASGHRRALLALGTFVIFAAITQFGILEPVRLFLTRLTAISLSTDAGVASILHIPAWTIMVLAVVGLALYIVRLWSKGGDITTLLGGVVIGLLVVAGWYITGVLAFDEFNPRVPSGITASGPMSRIGVMLIASDTPKLSYAISFVIGLAVMGFLYALLTGKFRWTTVPHGKMNSTAIGGALMGIGGTLGYGCNIGQGLTGLSTLSLESLLAVVAIYIGVQFATKKSWG